MINVMTGRDNVRQVGASIDHGMRWKDRASVGLGFLMTSYSRKLASTGAGATVAGGDYLATISPTD
jgi:hypothetical protein